MSRVILREVLEVPLYALALYAFWRGFQTATQSEHVHYPWKLFVLGGAALGAAQYVHTIPRGLFVTFMIFGLYLVIFQRGLFKRAWPGLLLVIVAAEIVAAPLLLYATLNPNVDNLPSFGASFYNPEETLVDRVQANLPVVLGQFTAAGDNAWEFNLPGRPIFEPVMGLLFLLGVVVAAVRFRSPPHAFTLIALAVSLLPSIMLDSNFAFARLVSGQPATFALLGLGLDALWRGLQRVVPARAFPLVSTLVAISLFAATAINTVRDMFNAWRRMDRPARRTRPSSWRWANMWVRSPPRQRWRSARCGSFIRGGRAIMPRCRVTASVTFCSATLGSFGGTIAVIVW
jgi:hypothetical protein